MHYTGSCHCGFVQFTFEAELDHQRICNCSVCQKRGAVIARIPDDALGINRPLSELSIYEWGSHTAKDYFCPHCGILPFRRPSAPTKAERAEGVPEFDGWAVNLRCVSGFDSMDLPTKHIHGKAIIHDT